MIASDIYSIALDLAKETSDNAVPAYQEARTLDWINWLRDQFFTQTELFRIVTCAKVPPSTALASAYTAGATTMQLDSVSGFNGAFVVSKELGLHTGKTTELTGVSNVNTDYAIDTVVQPLLKLPSNIISIHKLTVNGVQTQPVLQTTELGVFLSETTANAEINYTYSYRPTTLTSLEQDVIMDNPYHYYIVYGLIKIWKEVQESTADTSLETQRMMEIAQQAVNKRLQGRKLNITSFSGYTL